MRHGQPRTLYLPHDVWTTLVRLALEQGTSVSQVIATLTRGSQP